MSDHLFYNFSGGIDLSSSKTNLGLNTRKICWENSYNVEIYKDSGFARVKGNELLASLASETSVIGLFEYTKGDNNYLVANSAEGKFYAIDSITGVMTEKKAGLSHSAKPSYANYLNGVICSNGVDEPFFYEFGVATEIQSCNAVDASSHAIRGNALVVYKGRAWIGDSGTLYYSALGKFNDWATADDAGFIANFHNDSSKIVALSTYKDFLAIHKESQTYLLTGNSPDTFAIVPFANKGSVSPFAVIAIENKQFFFNNGVYTLEEVGALNQIRLSSEISKSIHPEFAEIDQVRLAETIAVPYETKSQVWFYFPYRNSSYFNICWIYDIQNNAWFKRVVPQNITAGCAFKGQIIVGTADGKLFTEDTGKTFSGAPIAFSWSSPFFSFSLPNRRKTIDEFYVNLDTTYDNNFNLLTSKDFLPLEFDDQTSITSDTLSAIVWNQTDWASPDTGLLWLPETETVEKISISGSNKSVQVHIKGDQVDQDFAVLGFEFRDVLLDE